MLAQFSSNLSTNQMNRRIFSIKLATPINSLPLRGGRVGVGVATFSWRLCVFACGIFSPLGLAPTIFTLNLRMPVNCLSLSGSFSHLALSYLHGKLSAPPPDHPAAKRHGSGATAAPKQGQSGQAPPPQRTKVNKIRYFYAPPCGIFSGTGTRLPQRASFEGLNPAENGRLIRKTK